MSGHEALFSGRDLIGAAPRGETHGARRAATSPAPAERGGRRAQLLVVANVLAGVGLFTVSWDRLLNLQVASYNVKVPSLVFSIAFVLAAIAARDRIGALVGTGFRRAAAGLVVAILIYEGVRAVFTPQPTAAAAQLVAILTGAVLPATTLLLVVRDRAGLRRALQCLFAGAAVAATFGVYQLFAFYVGWPQGISYGGVGIGSVLGRISAFNYEPAYFAYYVVLALGAYIALRRLDRADMQWGALIAFAAVLYLANVRAVPIVVLALAVLLLVAFRRNRRMLVRGAVVALVTTAVALAVPIAVDAVIAAQQQQQATAAESRSVDGPKDLEPTAEPSASISASAKEHHRTPVRALQTQLQTTVNPDEPSSNGPRLDLYRAVLAQVERSPIVGIGPGQLATALRREAAGTVQDQGGGQVVANNIWLQALADGGVPLLLLELALVVVIAVAALRRRVSAVYPMAAAWLAVVLVGGMLTSYLFDIKVWVVLALVIVGFGVADRSTDGAEEAAR